MKNTIITVGSVTYALKLQKLLTRSKIHASIIKMADRDGAGCTHGVEISEADFLRAVVLMRENDISYTVYSG